MLNFFRELFNNLFNSESREDKDTKSQPNIDSQQFENLQSENSSDKIMEGIEHVVVVMMENRSFDNVLGWLYKESEINDLNYIPEKWNNAKHLFDGLFPSNANNYVNAYKEYNSITVEGRLIFDSAPIEGITTNEGIVSDTEYFNSPPYDPWETFEHVTTQIFGLDMFGKKINGNTISPWIKPEMNGFIQSYASKFDSPIDKESIIKQIMEGASLRPASGRTESLSILNNLARHYATSDHWYCSVPSQTNPNRAWMACGTSEGQVNNHGTADQGTFTAKSIWEKINGSLTWKVFYEEVYLPISLGSYSKGTAPWTQNAFVWLNESGQKDKVQKIENFHTAARLGELPQFSFIEPSWTLEKHKLGSLEGLQGNECHPPGDVRPGEQFIGSLYTSLTANTAAWNKTLFIITFDEHGGTFDHIPPPPAIPDKQHPSGNFQFDRYGVRVPTIFISPQIKAKTIFRGPAAPNWDSSKPVIPQLDHTSIPATLLKWAGKKTPFGLHNRTDVAPTFEKVLNSSGIRSDHLIGTPNKKPNHNAQPLTFGDKFYLKLKYDEYEYYLSGVEKKRDLPKHPEEYVYYALANTDKTKEQKVWFTFPNLSKSQQDTINNQPLTHGSLLYMTSEAAPTGRPYLTIDYDDAYFAEDQKNSWNQWVIKLASANPGDLGQLIYDGDEIYLENRDNVAMKNWLPGKLMVNYSNVYDSVYITTTDDDSYTDKSKGIITIEKA